jgi:NAD(P)-dependent dehydrogenase (short-subunit alcohol dehydrogenase family)
VGEVDIVVNNASYFPNRSIDELDLSTWRRTIATNLDSHFLSVKYFLPTMRKENWGRFVGISSNMIGLAIPGMSHYIATKMGIIGFMRGLANDVASDGITANAVLPGLGTNTRQSAQFLPPVARFFERAPSEFIACRLLLDIGLLSPPFASVAEDSSASQQRCGRMYETKQSQTRPWCQAISLVRDSIDG